MDDVNQTL